MSDQEIPLETNVLVVLDIIEVCKIMDDIIPCWLDGSLIGQYRKILDACDSASSGQLHNLMHTWPEEVIALVLYQMNRGTLFLDRLFGGDRARVGDLLDQITQVMDKRLKERGEEDNAGKTCKAIIDQWLADASKPVH